MALAGFLGAINGAATRYSTRLEQAAENNASLTERMLEGRGAVSDARRDKNTLYYMSPQMQVISGKVPVAYDPQDPASFYNAVQSVESFEYQNNRLNFSITKTDDVIRNVDALVEADIGFQYSQFRNLEDELGEDVRRWEAATISALAGLVDKNTVKGEKGVPIALQPIHNQIPGWDNFTPDRKAYYNQLISKAFNYKKDEAEFVGLLDKTGTQESAPSFTLTEDDMIEIVPKNFLNADGTKTSIEDIPQEVVTSLTGVAQSRPVDQLNVYIPQTMEMLHSLNQAKSLPHVQGASTIQFLNGQFVSGKIDQNGGVYYSIPADADLIRQQTRKVYNQVGMGNFISLTAAAIPDNALYSEGPTPPGGIVAYRTKRRNQYEEVIIGVDNSEKRNKFNQKTSDLSSLKSNITGFIEVLESGAEIGAAGKIVLFANGAKAFLNSMQNLFANDPEYQAKFGAENKSIMDKLSSFTEKGQATQIALFLEKQLAYNIARALESSTGNARLSNIDVEMAQRSLGLSNLLANPTNAKAVLNLLLRRTDRELEYQKALGSRKLRTMQAAGYVQSLYGTDSMLRVTSADNQAAAYNELRSNLEAEAKRQGLTLTERKAPNTGRTE
ncbi:MAG: hypothetical protein CBB97_08360 [Candidatus Endolissoclinum sp. TMED37]|nr:MAG: hypothetical protein CBB97_08360 [Candidatus Endolissoclinum sp. TMED37]|tara:strand:+ start:216 stop:2054 length:1839 start_codon:yes stop_codon:yes gene_type:complete